MERLARNPSILQQILKPFAESAEKQIAEREKIKQNKSLLERMTENESKNLTIGQKAADLTQLFGADVGGAFLQGEKAKTTTFSPEKKAHYKEIFKSFGMKDDEAEKEAEAVSAMTVGAQTAYWKDYIEQKRRDYSGAQDTTSDQSGMKQPGEISAPQQREERPSSFEELESEYQFPKLQMFSNQLPKERQKRESEFYKENAKRYMELSDSIKNSDKMDLSLGGAEILNDSHKLPEGIERIQINPITGELFYAAGANAETQEFVKIINDFTTQAKDSYGARVTNFELDRFMKRLPGLLNSEEGRRIILKQMRVQNQIDKLEKSSERQVYDHYSLRGVDIQKADVIGRNLRKKKESELRNQYNKNLNDLKNLGIKSEMPKGKVLIEMKGKKGQIPEEKLDEYLKKGARLL